MAPLVLRGPATAPDDVVASRQRHGRFIRQELRRQWVKDARPEPDKGSFGNACACSHVLAAAQGLPLDHFAEDVANRDRDQQAVTGAGIQSRRGFILDALA